MTKFACLITAAAATLALAGTAKASFEVPTQAPMMPEMSFQPEVILAQARPPAGFNGNWYIAPNGCAYSRTQAPGMPAMWYLIQNPHHLGLPPRSPDCATTL